MILSMRTSLTALPLSSKVPRQDAEPNNPGDGSAIDYLRKLHQSSTVPAPPAVNVSRKESKRRAISPPLETPPLPSPETPLASIRTRLRSSTVHSASYIAANRRRTAEINRLALAKDEPETLATSKALVVYRPPPSSSRKLPPRKRASSDNLEEPPTRKARRGSKDGSRSTSDRPRSRPLPRRWYSPTAKSPPPEPNPRVVASSYYAPVATPRRTRQEQTQTNEEDMAWLMAQAVAAMTGDKTHGRTARGNLTTCDRDGNRVTLERSLAAGDAAGSAAAVQSLFEDSRAMHERTKRATGARREKMVEEGAEEGRGEVGPRRRKLKDVKKPYDRKKPFKKEE